MSKTMLTWLIIGIYLITERINTALGILPYVTNTYILRDTPTFIDISIASFYSQNEQKALGNLPSPIGRKKSDKEEKVSDSGSARSQPPSTPVERCK